MKAEHELSQFLITIGCPADKSVEMARQLDKRAQQLSASQGRSYEEAMAHLLRLMKEGWAAKERGL